MMDETKLNIDFWQDIWGKRAFEKYYGVEKYLAIHQSLNRLFKKYLVKGDKKILEIGCARGKQLIYFAKEFGYKVFGIDLSENGVALGKANMKIAGVKGTLLCEDIYKTSLESESFDVVYSMGLIEHFNNLSEIIDAHIKLLKKNGILILTVPNFRNSLYLDLAKVTGVKKGILATHNLNAMDKELMKAILVNRGLRILKLDYLCPIDFTLSLGIIKSKLALYFLLLINQVIGYLTFFMPSSKYFSPYLVMIARKL
jgi:2-polyprenyl-3-methyl-5-hydroxy-6-metoxy-1,4-benzoquinol methylase